ncbi:MAG: DUF3179 domain-containing (seleno)protein [Pseudomonadota bacterium]
MSAQPKQRRGLRLLYFVTTGVIAFWMAVTGTAAVLGADFLVERITHLGYPASFALLLGVAKLYELAAVTLPVPNRLREWAYAGSTFETLAAAYAYAAFGAPLGDIVVPFVILAVVQTSFWTWIATRKTPAPVPTLIVPDESGSRDFDREKVEDETFVKLYKTLHIDKNTQPIEQAIEEGFVGPEQDVFVLEADGEAIGITLRTLAYHHLAQGTLGETPFLVSFCAVCNAGINFDARIDGQPSTFSVGGVHAGTMIMKDDATGSLWDHLTGECRWGPHKGKSLDIIGSLRIVLAGDLLAESPSLPLARPRLKLWQKLVRRMQYGHTWRMLPEGKFYPGFRESFEFHDPRLPELEMGVGIWSGRHAVFYPLEKIRQGEGVLDQQFGTEIRVTWDTDRNLPIVTTGSLKNPPHHVFTRWYGFAQKFPGCKVY